YGDPDYLAVAGTIADFVLELVDTDGGVRFGPLGMFHPSGLNFFWNLKSTEQNERLLYMFDALYQVTGTQIYADTAAGIRTWIKDMYDFSAHLFCEAQIYDGFNWGKVTIGTGVSPTDVTAFAPLRLMLEDPFFGASLAARSQEVDEMFNAIEQRNAFIDAQNRPILFRFSLGQQDQTFGSIEWSSQMALAYLRAVDLFTEFGDPVRAAFYQVRYNTLIAHLETLFSVAPDDAAALIAAYAVHEDGSVAGGVLTGTGFATINAEAALASAYFAFAKAGFDPTITSGSGLINYGDVNDDGNITSIDASQVARHVVSLITLTPDAIVRGDVNGSGGLTSIDASFIARYVVGLITEFPVQNN
ncbi:MAG: dockerin type I repeat-containing protein, partial [Candidatus Omnitrophica bacterium]|nr:dockerin type I repeat-containing protein [Candidatus Omnitrophota bacterium]